MVDFRSAPQSRGKFQNDTICWFNSCRQQGALAPLRDSTLIEKLTRDAKETPQRKQGKYHSARQKDAPSNICTAPSKPSPLNSKIFISGVGHKQQASTMHSASICMRYVRFHLLLAQFEDLSQHAFDGDVLVRSARLGPLRVAKNISRAPHLLRAFRFVRSRPKLLELKFAQRRNVYGTEATKHR